MPAQHVINEIREHIMKREHISNSKGLLIHTKQVAKWSIDKREDHIDCRCREFT